MNVNIPVDICPVLVSAVLSMLCVAAVLGFSIWVLCFGKRKTVAERALMMSGVTGIAAAVQAVLALVMSGLV